jgi:hypothetical protein
VRDAAICIRQRAARLRVARRDAVVAHLRLDGDLLADARRPLSLGTR